MSNNLEPLSLMLACLCEIISHSSFNYSTTKDFDSDPEDMVCETLHYIYIYNMKKRTLIVESSTLKKDIEQVRREVSRDFPNLGKLVNTVMHHEHNKTDYFFKLDPVTPSCNYKPGNEKPGVVKDFARDIL